MEPSGLTRKFSICLTLDTKMTQTVNAIRATLPSSPYRDDTPHVTLLRTIKCPAKISDKDLAHDMERLLELTKNLPLSAEVRKPANYFSPIFKISSLLLLFASSEMRAYRQNIIKVLKANNYSVSWYERLFFLPHITIRLGVPFDGRARAMTKQSFASGTKLAFNKWIILRDFKKDGKYLVKEIARVS